jgi:hypothetical protein
MLALNGISDTTGPVFQVFELVPELAPPGRALFIVTLVVCIGWSLGC